MSIKKITEKEISENQVQGRENPLSGSVTENQSVFDRLPKLAVSKINEAAEFLNSFYAEFKAHSEKSVLDHQDGAVTGEKIAGGAVTESKIADGAVSESKIADRAVTESKIADRAVTESKIADGAVTSSKIANLSITTEKISGSSVTTDKLADMSVDENKLKNGSVSNYKLKSNSVTTIKIANEAVTEDKLSSEYKDKISAEFEKKADKEEGKGLSQNDFTDAYKTKLDNALTEHQDISGKENKILYGYYDYANKYFVDSDSQPIENVENQLYYDVGLNVLYLYRAEKFNLVSKTLFGFFDSPDFIGSDGFPLVKTKECLYIDTNTNFAYIWNGTEFIKTKGYDDSDLKSEIEELKDIANNTKTNTLKGEESVVITDSVKLLPAKGIEIFGNSVQDGTPAITAPYEIKSVTNPTVSFSYGGETKSVTFEGITLSGVTSAKDRIYVKAGKVYLEQNIKNSVPSVFMSANAVENLYDPNRAAVNFNSQYSHADDVMSNIGMHRVKYGVDGVLHWYIQDNNSKAMSFINIFPAASSDWTNGQTAYQWIIDNAGMPFEYQYRLKTPKVTEITGESSLLLLSILSEIKYESFTVSFSASNGVPVTGSVTYSQDLDKVIEKLTNAVIALGGNI